MNLLPVILAGGGGTRLWPLSTASKPKQFQALIHPERSLLQETLLRLKPFAEPLLICNHEHRFLVAEELRRTHINASVLLEPCGRNTAPAIAMAARFALEQGDDPVLLILPADHHIRKVDVFQQAALRAAQLAADGALVTFGMTPDRPETGYGYIRRGDAVADDAYRVAQFVEKPDRDTAIRYLASGEYVWNSGMFAFRASRFLAELAAHRPDMAQACDQVTWRRDDDFVRLDADTFAATPGESIDYAVMEHTRDAVVLPVDLGWSDVGSFAALWLLGDQDVQGDVVIGDVRRLHTANTYLRAESRRLIALGVEDVVVIESEDGVLVAKRDALGDLKQLL